MKLVNNWSRIRTDW